LLDIYGCNSLYLRQQLTLYMAATFIYILVQFTVSIQNISALTNHHLQLLQLTLYRAATHSIYGCNSLYLFRTDYITYLPWWIIICNFCNCCSWLYKWLQLTLYMAATHAMYGCKSQYLFRTDYVTYLPWWIIVCNCCNCCNSLYRCLQLTLHCAATDAIYKCNPLYTWLQLSVSVWNWLQNMFCLMIFQLHFTLHLAATECFYLELTAEHVFLDDLSAAPHSTHVCCNSPYTWLQLTPYMTATWLRQELQLTILTLYIHTTWALYEWATNFKYIWVTNSMYM